MNGKFWIMMAFLVSFALVGGSAFQRQGVTLHQLEDWRKETTKTWKLTIEQMKRIEENQEAILQRCGRK